MTSGQPIAIAILRALLGAAVMAGAAYFGQLAAGNSNRGAMIAAGVAFFGYLILRGGIEGLVDQVNAPAPPGLPPAAPAA